jgi:putative acetyltransferase
MSITSFPDAIDPALVGAYDAEAGAGGGYVWDEVLEYRVWCHPERGAKDLAEGSDYYFPFARYVDALAFAEATSGAEEPLALIRQREYISEPEPGKYLHIKEERITEWPVEFLRRPPRTAHTIPAFLARTAPPNGLDIPRGMVPPTTGHDHDD